MAFTMASRLSWQLLAVLAGGGVLRGSVWFQRETTIAVVAGLPMLTQRFGSVCDWRLTNL